MANKLRLRAIEPNFTLKDHIHEVLLEAIMAMDIYQDGVDLRLDERSLAEQLGISRTPVREALMRLEQDGFVMILPRRGVYIRRKSLEEILEMIIVWAALESMAARLAVQKASDADLKALRKLAQKYDARDVGAHLSEYSDDNIQFHQKILSLSKCALLRTTADGLFQHMVAVRRRAMPEDDRATKSIFEHIGIVEALESRDAELASTRVREHTMRLHDHVKRTWPAFEGAIGADQPAA